MSIQLEHPYFGLLAYDDKNHHFAGQRTDERVGMIEVKLRPFDHLPLPYPAIETVLPEVEARLDGAADYLREAIGERDELIGAVVEDLLETYNENWRCFSQSRGDGTWEEVEREVLDERSFAAALRFTAFDVALPIGPDSAYSYDAWLEPGDLFWDHRIHVSRSDSGFYVSLFG